MTSKAETLFYRDVNKRIPLEVYREKMYNPLRGGTPDFYYELQRSLWCEYKWVLLPARAESPVHFKVTSLQGDWLDRCEINGHCPIVVVGAVISGKKHGLVLQHHGWQSSVTCATFKRDALPLDALAHFIHTRVA